MKDRANKKMMMLILIIMTPMTTMTPITLLAGDAPPEPVRLTGSALPEDGRIADLEGLEVEARSPAQPQTILIIESPLIKGEVYQVRGTAACEGITGRGYLEMWSHFKDGSKFFTRTLAEQGPLLYLNGTGTRPFSLPFHLNGNPKPTRLVVNVFLPGKGKVHLSGLQFQEGAGGLQGGEGWWSAQGAGWVGGWGGAISGLLGAFIGVACAWGRGRSLVMALLLTLGGIGVCALVSGTVAWFMGQPYEVFYPLLLLGGLNTALPVVLWKGVKNRFEAVELRRIQAMDLA